MKNASIPYLDFQTIHLYTKQFFLFIGLFALPVFGFSQPLQGSKPNIIFIIGDDISPEDIGCYGNAGIKTPNIDKLAKTGIKFNNFFVTSSSCSPSRSSIITGRYPHNTGAAELHTPLPAHLAYFPELLRKAGYYTALSGKWHEGPNTKRAYDTLLVKDTGPGGEEQWLNVLQSRPKDKPFFFWFSPFDAHRGWDNEAIKLHHPDSVVVPPTLVDTKKTREDLVAYYNEIARIDFYLGKLSKALESEGIAENTMIIFMADNARAFPGAKTLILDRGIKTPFIVSWPKRIKKSGSECESLISSIDIAPTLLDLAGAQIAPSIQGVSFLKLLTKPQKTFRNYIFAEHNWHDFEAHERTVRSKNYLYLSNQRPQFNNGGPLDVIKSLSNEALKEEDAKGALNSYQKEVFVTPRPTEEFYDTKKDPLQRYNLINNPAYTKHKNYLKAILQQWQAQTGDTTPAKITGDFYDRVEGKKNADTESYQEMPGKSKNADHTHIKGPF